MRLTTHHGMLLTALCGLVPLEAGALGLGNISTLSRLNQPFHAEIPLIKADPDDIDSALVEIRPAGHGAMGSSVEALTRTLRGTLSADSRGHVVLTVSSHANVREPALSFVVDLSLPHAHVAREFSVLLDPALYAWSQRNAPPAAATRSERPAPASATPGSYPREGTLAGGTYGPVQPNETLWRIAGKVRPDTTVSTALVMEALHRANPQAFVNGDVNRLKVWARLRVPSRQEILTRTIASTGTQATATVATTSTAPAAEPATPSAETAASRESASMTTPAPLPEDVVRSRQHLQQLQTEVATLMVKSDERTAQIAALYKRLEEKKAAVRTAPAAVDVAPGSSAAATPAPAAPAASDGAGYRRMLPEFSTSAIGLVIGVSLLLGCLFLVLRRFSKRLHEKRSAKLWKQQEAKLREVVSQKAGQRAQPGEPSESIVSLWKKRKEKRHDSGGGDVVPVSAIDRLLQEVDLHLAYQQFDLAEKSVKGAIAANPDRLDLSLKLADVYLHAGYQSAFLDLAAELHELPEVRNSDGWRRIVIQGRQLFAEHPLFADSEKNDADDRHVSSAQILQFARNR